MKNISASARPGNCAPPPAVVGGTPAAGMAAYQKLGAEDQADDSVYRARIARELDLSEKI